MIFLSLWTLLSFLFSNIYLPWERENANRWEAEREKERKRENPKKALCCQHSVPRTVRSWPELRSRVRCLIDWATQALLFSVFLLGSLFCLVPMFGFSTGPHPPAPHPSNTGSLPCLPHCWCCCGNEIKLARVSRNLRQTAEIVRVQIQI